MKMNVGKNERIVSTVAGSLLTALGLRKRGIAGALLGAVGGVLLYRGVGGNCPIYNAMNLNTSETEADSGNSHTRSEYKSIFVEESIVIERSPEELYRFWRNFENLPRIMSHLASVHILDERDSHWVAKAPLGLQVEWDAELVYDKPNERIGWRSKNGADIDNAGSVHFESLEDGRTTRVHIAVSYRPPVGQLGAAVAKLLGEEPSVQIADDLLHFKTSMESAAPSPTVTA